MSRLHLVQTRLAWEDPAANRQHFEQLLAGLTDGLAVLPEMFTTGFSMASERLAEPMSGPSVQWLLAQSQRSDLSICGSLMIEDNGHRYNRFILVQPDGHLTTYDKRHLFRMSDEHQHYAAGHERPIIQLDDFRLCPMVCYDLRFPVWSRNREHYDLLIYVANWPAPRREQWLALLKARAIENLCYVVGVNRIGTDGNGVDYAGDSCAFGPTGDVLADLADRDDIATIDLDINELADYRARFPAHLDADEFEIR